MPTKEEIKHRIEVMQAWLDGKIIQTKLEEEWNDTLCPGFDGFSVGVEYRIKPEPKEIWVNEYEYSEFYVYELESAALKAADEEAIRVAVKYREVIEGE